MWAQTPAMLAIFTPDGKKKSTSHLQSGLVIVTGQKLLTRVGCFFCCAGQVKWCQPLPGLEIFPNNPKYFNFLYSDQKNFTGSAPYSLWVRSMFGLGQGPSLLRVKLIWSNPYKDVVDWVIYCWSLHCTRFLLCL